MEKRSFGAFPREASGAAHFSAASSPALQWLRRRWKRSLLVAAVIYVALVATGGCADVLLYFPSRGAIKPPVDAQHRLVPWDDQKQVEIWSMRSPGARSRPPAAYVLVFAGQGDRVEPLITNWVARWGNRPVEAWAVNLPGFGQTSGPGKLRSIPSAALAAYDGLKKAANGKPIIVSANSLGTIAALYVASRRHVDVMILQSPPPLHQIILRRYGWWNLWLVAGPVAAQVPTELEAVPHAKQVHAPAIFLMTDGDGTSAEDELDQDASASARR